MIPEIHMERYMRNHEAYQHRCIDPTKDPLQIFVLMLATRNGLSSSMALSIVKRNAHDAPLTLALFWNGMRDLGCFASGGC
jgi:hypothetical protein